MSASILVRRVLLGLCAATAVAGGAALVVMVVVYFAASEYLHHLQVGGYGVLVGVVGLGIYVGSAFRGHLLVRIAVGVCIPLAAFAASTVVAFGVSLLGDPGGERGNLEDGAMGAQWLLVGGYLAWQLLTGRWPAPTTAPPGPSLPPPTSGGES